MLTLRKVKFSVEGITPLLFCKKSEVDPKITPPKEIAASHLHIVEGNGHLIYMPGEMLLRSIRTGAKWVKGKGRGTMKAQLDATLSIEPFEIALHPQDWVLDIRSAYNHNMNPPVLITTCRPRFDRWALRDVIATWDFSTCNDVQLRECVDSAGYRVGCGSYSPLHGGPFGRYQVTAWDILEFVSKKKH